MRRGVTLAELMVVCTLLAVAAGIAAPRARGVLDGIRLRQAAHEVSSALMLARAAAIRRGERVRLVIDAAHGAIRIEAGVDTLHRRNLRAMHRVAVRASRDTITFAPTGMGFGVANSTIIVSIAQRAETVTVSRLGRARTSY
jgi:prepilin-type N-terminal cleavage/methylation domain-containing protein